MDCSADCLSKRLREVAPIRCDSVGTGGMQGVARHELIPAREPTATATKSDYLPEQLPLDFSRDVTSRLSQAVFLTSGSPYREMLRILPERPARCMRI
jgi:hypothetical protein